MGPRHRRRMPLNAKRLAVGVAVMGATLVATAGIAFAQDAEEASGPGHHAPSHGEPRHPVGQPALDRDRRGAGHLHAGRVRARRDRLLPGQARRPRGQHQLGHLLPGLRRLRPHRLPADVRRLLLPGARDRLRATPMPSAATWSAAATGSSLFKGGWAGTWFDGADLAYSRRRGRVLPLHGGLHGHHGHHPHRVDGRALEVAVLRLLGPVLRGDLLPAVRRLDLGRRLAVQARQLHELGQRLRGLRRIGRRARHGRIAALGRRARARAPHRQVRQGRQASRACPAITSRWPCWARSSCCSAGSASTPHPRSPRAIRSSAPSRPTPPSPRPSVASPRMVWIWLRTGKPDPGMMANGMLAGLVTITAPCAFVDPWMAAVHRRSSPASWSSSRCSSSSAS